MLTELFISILEISITTSIIIAALKILAPFINNIYAAKWKYWLWLIIAARLLIPVSIPHTDTAITVDLSDVEIYSLRDPIEEQRSVIPPAYAPVPLPARQSSITVAQAASFIWLAGMIVFILYNGIGFLMLKKSIMRWSRPHPNEDLVNMVRDISSEMGIKKHIALLSSDKASSPLLMGFLKPVIIMPYDDYPNVDMSYIIRHELTHYKRRDIWYKLILNLANAVHWFNPFAYMMSSEANMDLELSCDDEVIKNSSFDAKKEYSETILSTIKQTKIRRAVFTTFFYSSTNRMKYRFKNILDNNSKRNGTVAIIIISALILYVGALFSLDLKAFAHTSNGAELWSRQFDINIDSMNVMDFRESTNKIYNDKSTITEIVKIIKGLETEEGFISEEISISDIPLYLTFSGNGISISVSLPYVISQHESGGVFFYKIHTSSNVISRIDSILTAESDTNPASSELPLINPMENIFTAGKESDSVPLMTTETPTPSKKPVVTPSPTPSPTPKETDAPAESKPEVKAESKTPDPTILPTQTPELTPTATPEPTQSPTPSPTPVPVKTPEITSASQDTNENGQIVLTIESNSDTDGISVYYLGTKKGKWKRFYGKA